MFTTFCDLHSEGDELSVEAQHIDYAILWFIGKTRTLSYFTSCLCSVDTYENISLIIIK